MEKNYAIIKDQVVIDMIICNDPTDIFLNEIKTLYNSDYVLQANEDSVIGDTYDGFKFWKIQPYPSWTKNEKTNQWDSPVSFPLDGKKYTWNEEHQNWIRYVPPKPHDSWIFSDINGSWLPPLPLPQDGNIYTWNEKTLNWDLES